MPFLASIHIISFVDLPPSPRSWSILLKIPLASQPVLDRLLSIVDSDDGYAQSVNSHISLTTRPGLTNYDPYPAWSADKQIPISYEEIEDIFLDLTQKFGFQRDSMRNQVRHVKKCFWVFADIPF